MINIETCQPLKEKVRNQKALCLQWTYLRFGIDYRDASLSTR